MSKSRVFPAAAGLIVFTLLFCRVGGLLAQQPRIGAAPAWVREYPLQDDGASAEKDMDDGYVHLLVERQINIAEKTIYKKNVLQIETAAGVQNASQISIDYDPSYQRVIFHYIHIIRGGRLINGLIPSAIRTIHQEKDIYKSIYNGALTAMIFLEDVRKGDRIEYAYSLQGFNKVFGDKYFETLDAGFSVPVTHLYYKLICPAGRILQIKNAGNLPDPVLSATGAGKVYEWKLENLPAVEDDDGEPSWYDPGPYIMISEYRTWKEVNDWALSLFKVNRTPSGELGERIGRIRSAFDSPEKRVLAALRFVQDEVRYLGIEMGPNTHQPHDPEKVCTQRFGDCKDKALLLVTMLNALGITASPVLINADDKDRIRDQLPSPYAFNHATVRIRLDGKYYWLDPTISFQRGGISDISFPDFKCGLVLTDTTTGLTAIPLQDSGEVSAKELFTMSSLSGPARMDITTRYTGSFADDVRSDLNSSSLPEMQKSYLEFYDYYKDVKVRDSLTVEDDEQTGMVTTHEHYTIGKLWQGQSLGSKASFYALLVNSILPRPKDKERTAPFSLPYPLHYREEMEIRLPENWHFDGTPEEIKSPGFLFSSAIRTGINSVKLSYEYRTLQDYVDAGEAKNFYNQNEQVKDALGYELTRSNDEGGDDGKFAYNFHGTADFWEALILVVLCITAVVMHVRRRKRS